MSIPEFFVKRSQISLAKGEITPSDKTDLVAYVNEICLTTGEILAMLGRNPRYARMKLNPSFNPTKSDIIRRISLAEGEITPSDKTDLVEKASLSDAFSMVCLTGICLREAE